MCASVTAEALPPATATVAPTEHESQRASPSCVLEGKLDGRYTVLALLGAGSQSVVYLAADDDGQLVAIKWVQSGERSGRQGFLYGWSDIENERRVGIALQGMPEVRRTIEVVDDDVLVIEYINGDTLEDWLVEHAERNVSSDLADRWLDQFLGIIQDVLSRNVLPIDIAADNLMIDNDTMNIRLIDIADYIDLGQYDTDASDVRVYKPDYRLMLGDEEYLITPELVTYITAENILEITNALLTVAGKQPLGEEFGPKWDEYNRPTETYSDLEGLLRKLSQHVQQIQDATG